MKNAPKVGDTLIVQEDYRPTTYDCVITKVGRKLVHVHTGPMWNPMSFRIDPTKPFLPGTTPNWRAYTEKQWAFKKRREAFLEALEKASNQTKEYVLPEAFDAALGQLTEAIDRARTPMPIPAVWDHDGPGTVHSAKGPLGCLICGNHRRENKSG